MKINSEQVDGSRTPVNSLSNETSPGKSAETRRAMPLNVTEQEEREPKREELQRIIQLMDGFKASKVSAAFLVCTKMFPHLMGCKILQFEIFNFVFKSLNLSL